MAASHVAWSQAQSPNPTSSVSLEAWIKTTDTSQKGIFGKWSSDGSGSGDQSYEMFYRANGQPSGLLNAVGGTPVETDSTVGINDGNWHHVAISAPSTGQISIYVDGAPAGSMNNGQTLVAQTPDRLLVGATSLATGAGYMRGSLDEIRISNSARSADWIATEFRNQNSPATFYTIYPENANSIAPSNTLLSSSQSQQFTALFEVGALTPTASPLVLLGTAQTPSGAESLAINGNLAYVCDDNEVSVIDISNPAAPVFKAGTLSAYIRNDGLTHCAIQRNTLVAFGCAT